jgi:hypothetical protein
MAARRRKGGKEPIPVFFLMLPSILFILRPFIDFILSGTYYLLYVWASLAETARKSRKRVGHFLRGGRRRMKRVRNHGVIRNGGSKWV